MTATTGVSEVCTILHVWGSDDPALQELVAEERIKAAVVRQFREMRKSRGLTQREVADRAGMKQSGIARFENQRSLSLPTLCRIAEALGCVLSVALVPKPEP